MRCYSAHLKALQLIAALIPDETEFQGNVGIFLQQRDWLLIRDIERAIDEMIARLGDGEQTCLSTFSVYQTSEHPLSFDGISAHQKLASMNLKKILFRHSSAANCYITIATSTPISCIP